MIVNAKISLYCSFSGGAGAASSRKKYILKVSCLQVQSMLCFQKAIKNLLYFLCELKQFPAKR